MNNETEKEQRARVAKGHREEIRTASEYAREDVKNRTYKSAKSYVATASKKLAELERMDR